jgi:hypothetical protein
MALGTRWITPRWVTVPTTVTSKQRITAHDASVGGKHTQWQGELNSITDLVFGSGGHCVVLDNVR